MLSNALQLLQQRLESGLDAVLSHHDGEVDDVQWFHERTASASGPQVGRLLDLTPLEQTRVQHREGEPLRHGALECRHVLPGVGGQLDDQCQLRSGRLGVGEHVDARLGVVGNREARPLGGGRDGRPLLERLALGRRRKVLLHLGLDQFRVEVADDDNSHQIGPVPALVVGPQLLDGRGLDDLGQANRVPLGVSRRAEQQGQQALLPARGEPLVDAPLFQDDLALQLHLLRREGHRVGPVTENLERRLEDLGIVRRNLEEVPGGVVTGLGVQVRAKRTADGLEVGHDLLLGETLRSIEGHVLDEVRQPALFLLLQDRAGLHDERQERPAARLLVVPDVVGQPIAERAPNDSGIEGQESVGPRIHRHGRGGGSRGRSGRLRSRRGRGRGGGGGCGGGFRSCCGRPFHGRGGAGRRRFRAGRRVGTAARQRNQHQRDADKGNH